MVAFNIVAGPPAVIAPLKTGPFQPWLFPAYELAAYCPLAPFIGLTVLAYAILLGPSPGGADRPGGGPLAVLNEDPGPPNIAPFMACMTPETFWDPGDAIPCPDRTPRGFLEKLKRIPPLMLLWSGCP